MDLKLVDLDGVICDDRHRVQFALKHNWDRYFGLAALDTEWQQGRDLYNELMADENNQVCFLTGRREVMRTPTERWLKTRGFFGAVFMRNGRQWTKDTPKLADFKKAFIQECAPYFDSVTLYDDDPAVIEVVGAMGGNITAVHCTWHVKQKALVRRAIA